MKVCLVTSVFKLVGDVLGRWADSRLPGEYNDAAELRPSSGFRPKFLGGSPRIEEHPWPFEDKVEPGQIKPMTRVTRGRDGELLPPGVSNLATKKRLRRNDPRYTKRRPF